MHLKNDCLYSSPMGVAGTDNTTMVCSDGDIRLRGAEPHAGIIEMCVSSVWRSVCASSQSRSEGWANMSRIACEQLDLNTQGVCVCVGGGDLCVHVCLQGLNEFATLFNST